MVHSKLYIITSKITDRTWADGSVATDEAVTEMRLQLIDTLLRSDAYSVLYASSTTPAQAALLTRVAVETAESIGQSEPACSPTDQWFIDTCGRYLPSDVKPYVGEIFTPEQQRLLPALVAGTLAEHKLEVIPAERTEFAGQTSDERAEHIAGRIHEDGYPTVVVSLNEGMALPPVPGYQTYAVSITGNRRNCCVLLEGELPASDEEAIEEICEKFDPTPQRTKAHSLIRYKE
jgi:hypothetical protein